MAIMLVFLTFLISCQTTVKPIPPDAVSSVQIARRHIESSEFDLAIKHLSPQVRRFPDVFDLKMLLGLSYLGNGDLIQAKNMFEKALRLNRDSEDAQLNLAYTLIQIGQTEKSRKILKRIISKNTYPNIEKVYINYGLSYLTDRQYQEAEKAFQEALVFDPRSPSALYNLGICAQKQNQPKRAIEYLKQAHASCLNCVDPSLLYAEILIQLGQKDESQAIIDNLKKNSSLNTSQKKWLKKLDELTQRQKS